MSFPVIHASTAPLGVQIFVNEIANYSLILEQLSKK